jgi:hypothetical protein
LKEEFLLTDGATEFDFFHVKYSEGRSGYKFKHLHLDKENCKKSKRTILQIYNPWDSLWLPRALIVARLHSQKPEHSDPEFQKKWMQMRYGDVRALDKKEQALALMEEA